MKKRILLLVLFCISLSFFTISSAYARSIENIKKTGVIKIATRNDVPPIHFANQDGTLSGIDPDLGNLIADALGVKVEWIILKGPKYRSDVLLDKSADLVISSFSVTKERLAVINFSEPYFTTGLALMIKESDKDKIKSYKDLSGRKVSTTKGSTGEKALAELVPDAVIVYANETPATYENLIKSKADAVINDKVFLDHYAAANKRVYVIDGTITADQYGVGVNKDDADLLAFVNSLIVEAKKNGKLDAVIKKYIGNSSKVEVAEKSESPEKKDDAFITHVVQPNDTLSKLAIKYYGDATKWNVILASNADVIKFANALEIGWKIKIPGVEKPL